VEKARKRLCFFGLRHSNVSECGYLKQVAVSDCGLSPQNVEL